MKTLSTATILLLIVGSLTVFAQETSSEMKRIDDRLEELKTIWRQDTAIINQLTNFKKTPVQEGTQAYYKCLEASKRIQQAEAEAKNLKEKRNVLTSSAPTTSVPQTTSITKSSPKPEEYDTAASKMKQAWLISLTHEKAKKSGTKPEIKLATQDERSIYAKKILADLNPANFLHPLERTSPTLSLIKAEVTLQGKNLKEIQELYTKGNLLDLLSYLNGEKLNEYPEAEEIEKLCTNLAEMPFFIRLRCTDPPKFFIKTDTSAKGNIEESEISMVPTIILPESNKTWFATLVFGNGAAFETHPDGESAGYLAKWSPSDGPVLLKLPLRADTFTKIIALERAYRQGSANTKNVFDESEQVSALSDERSKLLSTDRELYGDRTQESTTRLGLLNTALEKKIDIGEITEEQANQDFINSKTIEYKDMLRFLSEW